MEAWLREPGRRRAWLVRQSLMCVLAWVVAHVMFALATLIGSGHLPDWGQYLAYAKEFLFGGSAGSITYGFANWSPGLAMDGAVLISAAALVLLLVRRAELARANAVRVAGPGREHRLRVRDPQLHRQPLLDLPAAVRGAAAADGRHAVAVADPGARAMVCRRRCAGAP